MRDPREEMSFRLSSAFCTIILGILFFLVGIYGIIEGDSGPSPTYHAGWMLFGSLIFVTIYFIFELIIPPDRPWRAPRLQLGFTAWMAIGGIALVIVESRNPGECCANPTLRQQISLFSLLWPLLFAVPVYLRIFLFRRANRQMQSEH